MTVSPPPVPVAWVRQFTASAFPCFEFRRGRNRYSRCAVAGDGRLDTARNALLISSGHCRGAGRIRRGGRKGRCCVPRIILPSHVSRAAVAGGTGLTQLGSVVVRGRPSEQRLVGNGTGVALKMVVPPLGSIFGSTHGFTQMGATGVLPVFAVADGEGLYASAVADAATVTCVLPQMRAKNVGRLACTLTVTVGLV